MAADPRALGLPGRAYPLAPASMRGYRYCCASHVTARMDHFCNVHVFADIVARCRGSGVPAAGSGSSS